MKPSKSTRTLHNSSTMRGNNTLELVDRISVLPDSILGLILSNLPTKNAVSTTILSKRWKFVWMNVHNLDFCLKNGLDNPLEDVDTEFIQFVNHVLIFLDCELLNKFSLKWSPMFIPTQVNKWIHNAITRNVHQLILSVWSFHPSYKEFQMPLSFFTSVSLQYLELKGSISFSTTNLIFLPRLETLKLHSVYFKSEDVFEKLISGCPILNHLHIHVDVNKMETYSRLPDDLFEDFTYIISSNSLKCFEFDIEHTDVWCTPALKLKASSIEYLKLIGYIPHISVQETLSSLVEVDYLIHYSIHRFTEDRYNSIVEVVRAFDCAKTITLSMDVMWAITKATICLSTKFKRLTKLEIGAISCYCSGLQDFIQCSDNLEVLTVMQGFSHQHIGYLEQLGENQYGLNWITPVEVPRCFSNSLKKVYLEDYAGLDEEREMIRYMLKHGSVLEVMDVACYTWKKKELVLVKEICSFPRNSQACQVRFM